MICPKCKKEIEDAKICPSCGAEIEPEENSPTEAAESEKAPDSSVNAGSADNGAQSAALYEAMKKVEDDKAAEKKKKKKKIGIGCGSAVALLVVILVVLGIVNGKKSDDTTTGNEINIQISRIDGETAPLTTIAVRDPAEAIAEAKACAEKKDYAGAIKALKGVQGNEEADALRKQYAAAFTNAADYGCYWEEDEMSDYHWAYANGQESKVKDGQFMLYISQEKKDPSKLNFHLFSSFTGYSGSTEWVFPNAVRIKGDGDQTIDFSLNFGDRKSDMDGRLMMEWCNFWIEDEQQYEALCNLITTSKTVTVRFTGATYHHDITLTQAQIDAVNTIHNYATVLKEAYQ
ncbi:MAG: zinc ribbon domain-containing protein [Clostridia bacterium]|nr:zinc ribbon domain-containing protein [Clostridia bacterium]